MERELERLHVLVAPRVLEIGLALARGLLAAEVLDGALDGVLGQHRAVDLHRRQRQLVDDIGVLDRERLVDGLALEPFGREARARNRRAATERLELRIVDDAGLGAVADGAAAHEVRRHRHVERLTDRAAGRAAHVPRHVLDGLVPRRDERRIGRAVPLRRAQDGHLVEALQGDESDLGGATAQSYDATTPGDYKVYVHNFAAGDSSFTGTISNRPSPGSTRTSKAASSGSIPIAAPINAVMMPSNRITSVC